MITKPGKGWNHLGGPVWEKEGLRVHWGHPLLRFQNQIKNMHEIPGGQDLYFMCKKITGGNKKRAAMIWALNATKGD